MIRTRICLHCLKVKPEFEFHYQRSGKPSDQCSVCYNQIRSDWTQRNPEYSVWNMMKQRCINPYRREYHNYGGRGIKVCPRWMTSFKNFISDMGHRPSSNYQLDRIDNNGDYSPENCQWVLPSVNAKNRRTSKISEDDLTKISVAIQSGWTYLELSREYRISRGSMWKIVEQLKKITN